MSVDLNSPTNIRRLKLAVILLGAMIIIALVAMGLGFYRELAVLEKAARKFGDVSVELPAGSNVVSSSVAGDRLVVHLRLAGDTEEIWLLDLATGERLGRIQLNR